MAMASPFNGGRRKEETAGREARGRGEGKGEERGIKGSGGTETIRLLVVLKKREIGEVDFKKLIILAKSKFLLSLTRQERRGSRS